MAGEVKVTFTVTIEMTGAQRAAYSDRYGVGFVETEIAGRGRQTVTNALEDADWLDGQGTFSISKPQFRTPGYDPLRDLAHLLVAVLNWRTDDQHYADRIASHLGLGEDDSPRVVHEVLAKALGVATAAREAGEGS